MNSHDERTQTQPVEAVRRLVLRGEDALDRAQEFSRSVQSRFRELTGQAPPDPSGLSGTAAGR